MMKQLNQPDNKRILLVEDNDLNASIAIAELHNCGILVDWVKDVSVCVENVKEAPAGTYSLILIAIQENNAYGSATKEIRGLADQRKASIPIIVLTTNDFQELILLRK